MSGLDDKKIADDILGKISGGLGGEYEATCPKCGKPMRKEANPYGTDSWKCDGCKETQFLSDAEYILMLKTAEQLGQTQGLVYPVWWDKVK